MLDKKILQAKIGKVKIHGNYAVISGDPFAFCQKIFGCDIPDEEKGLLKAGEMYSQYWTDYDSGEGKRVVCFRAPMSTHNNIRCMNVVRNDEIDFWFQHMPTVNIINVHDMFYPALSGADNDGDAILTTDNEILLKKWRDEPAILCVQKKGQKSIITQENLAKSNKSGFGNSIGAITNRVTAMYDIMSNFSPDSEQHKVLEYRIRCGQQYQQAEIDKIKGIVSKPMPSYWYTRSKVKPDETDTDEMALFKEENREIVANKKPYFMKYIYRDLGKRTNDYIKNADMKSLMNTNLPLKKILSKIDLTENESAFVEDYRNKLPVTDNGSVMNRLSHISEELLKRIGAQKEDESTDFIKMLSSGFGKTANSTQMQKLRELYKQYRSGVQAITMRCDKDEKNDLLSILQDDFQRQALDVCCNMQTLCDSLLKICYKSQFSKRFVWKVCGEQIVENLINKHGEYTCYIRDDSGDVEFRGRKYKKITRSAFEDIGNCGENFEVEFEDEDDKEEDYEYDFNGDE